MSQKLLFLLRIIITSGLLFLVLCCGPTQYGTFVNNGFNHANYGYSVLAPSDTKVLLPKYWRLDNYYVRGNKLVPKQGADYESTVYIDLDFDGKDEEVGEFYTYDLRYTHVRNAGVIWLRTIPISDSLKQKELRILARSYIDSLAATHYEVVQLEGKLYRTTSERHYATAVVAQTMGSVAGQDAYAVTVDVANVHQLQLSKDSRTERVLLVFIRTPFVHRIKETFAPVTEVPVLMIAGYANLVEDFDDWIDDFKQFVARIVIEGNSGAEFTEAEKTAGQKSVPIQTGQPMEETDESFEEVPLPELEGSATQTEKPGSDISRDAEAHGEDTGRSDLQRP